MSNHKNIDNTSWGTTKDYSLDTVWKHDLYSNATYSHSNIQVQNNTATPLTSVFEDWFSSSSKNEITKVIDSLERIEQRLAILERNVELEKRWIELRELGERYTALEKEILEKEQIWDELKK